MKLEINVEMRQGNFDLNIATVLNTGAVGIYGASGAGKSTLLHLISGLKKPDKGRIVLNDRVLVDTAEQVFVQPHKRGIGLVFQEGRLFPHMSVKRNLLFGRRHQGNDKIIYNDIIDILELKHLLTRFPVNLSGGERQRVALGRALLSSPDILLFDEPFSAIDKEMRGHLLEYIARIHNKYNLSFLMISHDLSELLMLTDYFILLGKGRLMYQGNYIEWVKHDFCINQLINSGAGSSFWGVIRSRNKLQGIAEIEVCNQGIKSDNEVIVLAPYVDSIGEGVFVRGRVASKDVILSSAPVEYISAQNQLQGVVKEIHDIQGRMVVQVDIGGIILLTEITNKSYNDFIYAPEKRIWAIFKTWSVNYLPCKQPEFYIEDQISQPAVLPRFDDKNSMSQSGLESMMMIK